VSIFEPVSLSPLIFLPAPHGIEELRCGPPLYTSLDPFAPYISALHTLPASALRPLDGGSFCILARRTTRIAAGSRDSSSLDTQLSLLAFSLSPAIVGLVPRILAYPFWFPILALFCFWSIHRFCFIKRLGSWVLGFFIHCF
jgi:hypothetical protein